MTAPQPDELTPREAAAYLRVGLSTLRDWRRDGRGPACWKQGGIVRYTIADLEAFKRSRRIPSSAA